MILLYFFFKALLFDISQYSPEYYSQTFYFGYKSYICNAYGFQCFLSKYVSGVVLH